jgi:hypothetical protein
MEVSFPKMPYRWEIPSPNRTGFSGTDPVVQQFFEHQRTCMQRQITGVESANPQELGGFWQCEV